MSTDQGSKFSSRVKDLTGQTFGRLTAIAYVGTSPSNKAIWLCRCSCGKEVNVVGAHLKNGHTKTCGCLWSGTSAEDMTGQVFGRLTAVEYAGSENKRTLWQCQCSCGNRVTVPGKELRNGHTKSCGCLHKDSVTKHDKSYVHEYRVWLGMVARCHNPENQGFGNYGGRGIRVCDGWRENLEAFLADVGTRPSSRHSIDRANNDGNYSCGKCEECLQNGWPMNTRWATTKEQGRNQRTNRLITCNGETKTLTEWSEVTGLPLGALWRRLTQYGWTPEEAINTPKMNRGKQSQRYP